MFDLLILALAAAAQDRQTIVIPDPPAGPMPGENRTLSQPHPYATARTFPDVAVKSLRIDGDTLYVLVANDGEARARGPILISAQAESNGARALAVPARIAGLLSGQRRWVPLRNFSVKSAAANGTAAVFALEDASFVSASATLATPMSAAVDRTGQGCLPSRGCVVEPNEANNSLRADGKAILRGRP